MRFIIVIFSIFCVSCGGSGSNDKTETNQIEETLLLDVPFKINFSYEGYGWKSIEHGHVELIGENIVSASQIWDGCEGSSGQSQCYDTRMMSNAVLAPQNYETWRGSVISNVSETRDPNSTDGRYRDYNFNMIIDTLPSSNKASMSSKRFAVSTSWYNWPDYLTISNQIEQGRESLPDYFDVSSETYLTITTYVNDGLDENGFNQYRKIALVDKIFEDNFVYNFNIPADSPYWDLDGSVSLTMNLEHRLTVIRNN